MYACLDMYFMYIHADTFNTKIVLQIKYITLNNNTLQILNNVQFRGLINLEFISLRYNSLTKIAKDIFRYNTKLRKIDLEHNYIHIFNADLSKLPNLIKLLINHNKLNKLSEYAFKYFISGNKSHTRYLFVHNNYLTCNCAMYWMLELEETLRANIKHDKMCTYSGVDMPYGTLTNIALHCFVHRAMLATSTCEHLNTTHCQKGLYNILILKLRLYECAVALCIECN